MFKHEPEGEYSNWNLFDPYEEHLLALWGSNLATDTFTQRENMRWNPSFPRKVKLSDGATQLILATPSAHSRWLRSPGSRSFAEVPVFCEEGWDAPQPVVECRLAVSNNEQQISKSAKESVGYPAMERFYIWRCHQYVLFGAHRARLRAVALAPPPAPPSSATWSANAPTPPKLRGIRSSTTATKQLENRDAGRADFAEAHRTQIAAGQDTIRETFRVGPELVDEAAARYQALMAETDE
ncbi:hypothetical protein MMC18_008015, partial [Xylographa bjoerkii]|nr:hypothetical protein [Xylographa bjoerkii]